MEPENHSGGGKKHDSDCTLQISHADYRRALKYGGEHAGTDRHRFLCGASRSAYRDGSGGAAGLVFFEAPFHGRPPADFVLARRYVVQRQCTASY